MRNFFTEIESNKNKSIVIIAGFIGFISAIGYFTSMYFGQGTFTLFLAGSLILSGIMSYISYYYSDQIVLKMSNATLVERKDNPQIYNLLENLCIGTGLPTPKLYIIEDTAMNAFATGRDPQNGVVCLTTGIISRLNKKELEGVIAHELAHIGNYDIRLASLVSVLVGTIVLLSDWISHGIFYASDEERNLPPIMYLIFIVVIIAAPIIGAIIQLAISRKREYLADATAASMTRYPEGLASALEKISGDEEILEAANGATAHLYISNPLGHVGGFLAGIFSTHPPIDERIKRLREM